MAKHSLDFRQIIMDVDGFSLMWESLSGWQQLNAPAWMLALCPNLQEIAADEIARREAGLSVLSRCVHEASKALGIKDRDHFAPMLQADLPAYWSDVGEQIRRVAQAISNRAKTLLGTPMYYTEPERTLVVRAPKCHGVTDWIMEAWTPVIDEVPATAVYLRGGGKFKNSPWRSVPEQAWRLVKAVRFEELREQNAPIIQFYQARSLESFGACLTRLIEYRARRCEMVELKPTALQPYAEKTIVPAEQLTRLVADDDDPDGPYWRAEEFKAFNVNPTHLRVLKFRGQVKFREKTRGEKSHTEFSVPSVEARLGRTFPR